MIVTFVVDTSASMGRTTLKGLSLLDYAKSTVELFLKRIRDPNRNDHFLLVTTHEKHVVQCGWENSLNKDEFNFQLKNLAATQLSDLGKPVQVAFSLMNQYRLQVGTDNYALGRAPYLHDLAICVLITDATNVLTKNTDSGDFLHIPPSTTIGSDLTNEPFRWDQRLYTIALKIPGASNHEVTPKCPAPLKHLSELTGGSCFAPTSESGLQQCVEQIISKLKPGVAVVFRPITCGTQKEIEMTPPLNSKRSILSAKLVTKDYSWPIPESFWVDRNLVSLPPRDAHPILLYKTSAERNVDAATTQMVLETLKFPVDTYLIESSPQNILTRGQRWMVYVHGSKGDNAQGDPIGFLQTNTTHGNSTMLMLSLLPYNFPSLFTLLVEAARIHQSNGNAVNSNWQFQTKSLPSSWRQSFAAYLSRCPHYYHNHIRKALMPYNLHGFVPEVPEGGRSYQIASYLKRLRDLAAAENEKNPFSHNNSTSCTSSVSCNGSNRISLNETKKNNKIVNDCGNDFRAYVKKKDPACSFSSYRNLFLIYQCKNANNSDFLSEKQRKKTFTNSQLFPSVAPSSPARLTPSYKAQLEDQSHSLLIDVMGDFHRVLEKKEAPRNPIGDPEPDEDSLAGLRRRQLANHFNFGSPYRRNSQKQQAGNVDRGEDADEAAILKGQPAKRSGRHSAGWRRDSKRHRQSLSSCEEEENAMNRKSQHFQESTEDEKMDIVKSPELEQHSIRTLLENKKDMASLLGVSEYSVVQQQTPVSPSRSDCNFTKHVYSILARNHLKWTKIQQIIRLPSPLPQVELKEIQALLSSIEGGSHAQQAYCKMAITQAKLFNHNNFKIDTFTEE